MEVEQEEKIAKILKRLNMNSEGYERIQNDACRLNEQKGSHMKCNSWCAQMGEKTKTSFIIF